MQYFDEALAAKILSAMDLSEDGLYQAIGFEVNPQVGLGPVDALLLLEDGKVWWNVHEEIIRNIVCNNAGVVSCATGDFKEILDAIITAVADYLGLDKAVYPAILILRLGLSRWCDWTKTDAQSKT